MSKLMRLPQLRCYNVHGSDSNMERGDITGNDSFPPLYRIMSSALINSTQCTSNCPIFNNIRLYMYTTNCILVIIYCHSSVY